MAKTEKLLFITIFALMVIALISPSLQGIARAESTNVLPPITKYVKELPTLDPSPGHPAVVLPGGTFSVTFKTSVSVSQGYISTVVLEDNKLVELKYTVTVSGSGSKYTVKLPSDVKPALYDLVLQGGGKEYFIPRSVWVISGPFEILTFVHMSDLHFGTGHPNETIGQYRRFAGEILAQLLHPNIVINTGDEADTQALTQYQESRAFRYAFLYPLPVFLNPGNHDYPNGNFIKYYGQTTWYRIIGQNILLVALNTRGEDGYPSWNELKWLTQILEKYKDIPIKIIQFHHPVFYYQGQITTTWNTTSPILGDPHKYKQSAISYYWGTNLTAARYFLKLCEEYHVNIVLAGHIHRDQYVEYHSTWTGWTTYFITTTTLAHGTGRYQGLQYVRVQVKPFNLTFPYAPPTFVGFKNVSRYQVYNSIPVTLPKITPNWNYKVQDDQYYYGFYHYAPHAYIMGFENYLPELHLDRTILLALPWAGDTAGLKVLESQGNASASIVTYKVINGRLYVALHIKLEPKSKLVFALYNAPDNTPPLVKLGLMIPSTPTLGRANTIFFTIKDEGWGVKNVKATITVNGKTEPLKLAPYSRGTYQASITLSGTKPLPADIKITVSDWAGNTKTYDFKLTFYPPGYKPTTTTTTTTTSATTTTTTTTATTTTTTTTTTTVPPQTTTTITPSATSPTTTSTATPPSGGVPAEIIASIVIIIVAIIIAVVIVKKK